MSGVESFFVFDSRSNRFEYFICIQINVVIILSHSSLPVSLFVNSQSLLP